MAEHRFVQISDVHLGAPLGWLPSDRRIERHREQQRALAAAVELAVDRTALGLLIPGDLFDAEGVDAETMAFAVHVFNRAGCPPVFISPGNHDPSTQSSATWNPRLLAARGWAWAPHVHVFREPAWSGVPLAGGAVTVWGRSFASDTPSRERPLAARALPAADAFASGRLHVGVFHGSLEDRCPPGQSVTGPFSEAEVLQAPFAYMAVGHYHQASRIDDESGTRLAYAGSAVALNATEPGAHGALVVTLEDGARAARIEAVTLDPRRMHAIDLDVTGAASADEIDQRLLAALDAAGVTERDIVRARLAGRVVRGVRYAGPGAEVTARVFALRADGSGVRPDYDIEALREREPVTTEDRFAHALLAELDQETDPERRARVLSALYYGLDAFRLREVTPAYESLAAPAAEVAS